MQNKFKYAIGLAVGTALISGTSNFLAKIAVTVVKDPVVFTFLKNIIVAAFLVGVIMLARKWKEVLALNKKDWIKLAAIGIIGGSIPFILFFTGLSMIPAINAAFIHKTLFIWVAILAVPFLKERVGIWPAIAILALFGGNSILGFPHFTFGIGELMVLGATLLWAVENIIAKKALEKISSLVVAGARMLLGSVIIFAVVAFQGKLGMLGGFSGLQWFWIIVPSVLLTGYILTWYTALKYAPATVVASVLVLATFVTSLLQAIFITHVLSIQQLAGGILSLIGSVLIISQVKKIIPEPKTTHYPLPTTN